MSAKAYIISLSLTGAAAACGCWLFMGGTAEKAEAAGKTKGTGAKVAPVATAPGPATRTAKTKSSAPPRGKESELHAKGKANVAAAAAQPGPAPESLTPEARAARVEQEANHELRRLVSVLNLSEAQQDQVFHTLARGSRYWTPDMQAGAAAATTSGKRNGLADAALTAPAPEPLTGTIVFSDAPAIIPGPGNTSTFPDITGPAAVPIATTGPAPGASDNAKIDDPMSEIMSLLTPEQQTALLETEMDRTAWWAEILPQILPPEDVPGLNPGDQQYEGADRLE